MMSTPTTTDLAPVTSSRDLKLELPITFDYECRYLTLENGMCALLVHDPTAEKAGVGVGVAAGSYHNPSDTEGLAHFLEHMLFLGTEKYPDEGGYADFISKNGGSRNAYTAVTNTIYYFSVKWDKLFEGLDRLAQFFVAPLFTESATDREIHAIDNEFNRAKEAPVWKAHVLSSVFATPDNPARKFTIGNLATLGSIPTGELRSRLIAFYKAYYLPAAMKVTVVSRHPLDELETLFRTAFAPVPKAPAGVEPKGITVEREALQQSQQQQRAWLTKGMEVHAYLEPGKHYAVLQWEEGRGLDYYRKNPGAYITHLMGHESEGSVALYLKRKGIAHSLTCGYENGPRYSTISCKIVFTEEGWPRREEALAAVFEYIGMMRRAGPQEWVFREVSNSSKAIFLCSSKGKQEDIASTFASNLLSYNVEDVVNGGLIFDEWDTELVKAWTDRLTPENCNIIYSSKDFENTATDSIKHFDISYSIAPIAEDLVERFNTAMTTTTTTTYGKEAVFHLPERNPYVPDPQHLLAYKTPLTDKGSTSFRAPSEVYSSPQTVFYHKQDRAFGAPYVYMSLNLFPQERESVAAQDAAVRIIVGSLMNDAFLTWTYLGKVANVTSNVGFGADGVLEIGVKSYNDNFQPFAKRLLGEVRAYKPDPARFAVVKEKCALRLESELMTKSGTTIAKDLFSQCVTRSAVPSAEVLASLRGLTCDAVTAWLAGFWAAGVKVAAYVYGAISEAEAKEFAADAEHIVDTPVPAKIVQNIVASIPAGCDRVIDAEVPNEKETNSCVYDVFEVGRGVTCPDELSQALCANLLVAVVKAAAFKVLRTKEQLGYLVWTMSSTVLGVKYIKFVVMSASHTPRHVDSRIEAFIESYRSILEDIPLEEFEERKKGLVSDIADSKRDMQDEFSSLSWEFFNGTFLWQRSAVASKLVMALTKEDVLRMYDTALLNKSTRRKLSVQLHSRVHKDQDIPLCDIRDPACHFNSFAKEWNNFQPMPDPFSPDKACKDFSFDN